jgi:hypothetical protein
MRKTGTLIVAVIILILTAGACNSKTVKEVNVVGNWAFEKYVPGAVVMSPQSKAMVEAIVSVFKDCKVSYLADGKVEMSSPVIGIKSGTYTVTDGKLDQQMGKRTQFILHVKNEGEKLVVLFNEDDTENMGKIFLVAKQ